MNGRVTEGDAQQAQYWQEFYEKAWEARATYMRQLIAGGESDPARIVNLAEQRERTHKLQMVNGTIEWEKREFAGETIPSGMPVLKSSSFRGNFLPLPFYAAYNFFDLVVDYAEAQGPFDYILELGCGYGQNLFRIFSRGGPNIPYFGGEFTESGVRMARDLADLAGSKKYEFFHFNHLKPDLSFLEKKKKVLVFTSHTIEQVFSIASNWFDVVADIAEDVRCVHLEPFGFQMQNLGPATRAHAEFFAKQNWNHNFALVAKEAQARGVIKVENIMLETTFPVDPSNPSSLLFWRKP